MQKATVTVAVAAQLIGCSQQTVRERIKRGIWTFGEAIPEKNHINYVIYKRKLYRHLGIDDGGEASA